MPRLDQSRIKLQPVMLAALGLGLLTGLFLLTPWSGDDWGIYHGAAQRVFERENLYETRVTFGYFYNPPWVAVAFTPLGLLPEKLGWAMVCAASLGSILWITIEIRALQRSMRSEKTARLSSK